MARSPYNSATWRKLRPKILARDGHRCQIVDGCDRKATDVDHIIPVSQGGSWYDPSNLRAACEYHNSGRARGSRDLAPTRPSRDWYED